MKKLISLLKLFTLLLILTGCVKDKDFSSPEINCSEPELIATNTIQQVKEMYRFGGPTVIENDVIIEGYVVSSDESENIYKTISIQDKPVNPSSAIKIAINQNNLYTKYNIGRKVFIKLKGLAIGFSFGSFQIGKAAGNDLERISSFEVNNYIFRSCEVAEIQPKIVSISDFNEAHLEMLIEIENVQFNDNDLDQSYGNLDNISSVDRILEIFDSTCSPQGEIILRISGYSDFKNENIPSGNGTIIGVLSNYYDDFQLYIRNTEDLNFNNERCDYSTNIKPTISIADIRKMYEGKMVEFGVSENFTIEGFVISSDFHGNFQQKLVIQDAPKNPDACIQLLLDKEHLYENFNIGDKIIISLNKLYMAEIDGILSIGIPKKEKLVPLEESQISKHIFNTHENFEILPKEILIAETTNINHESTLVKVSGVQLLENELGKAYTYYSGNDDGLRILESCNETIKLAVLTSGEATFSKEEFPVGHGNIVGILNRGTLKIRETKDVDFSSPFEKCPVIIPYIMITEIADPENSVSSRFIELYNAGESQINLEGWKINKYINGSTSISSSPIELHGVTIQPKDFVIIANSGYEPVFNEKPTIESSYISGNGDDVYELMDNSGNRMDIYGVIGEDGNGTNWEYLDGRAIRNSDINMPNKNFNINEWTVYSKATNNLISYPNSPKIAPNDYSPNYR